MAFKIRQNPFLTGTLPRTPLGELTTSPYPTPIGTDSSSALAMRLPQNSSQIYAYAHMGFRLVPKSVTLNGVGLIALILRYFTEFDRL